MDVIEQYMRSNPGMTSKQLAETLNAALPKQTSPTRPGNFRATSLANTTRTPSKRQRNGGVSAKWEEENAATLPPGYKEMMLATSQGNQGMQNQVARLEQLTK